MKISERTWQIILAVLVVLDIFGPLALGAGDPPLGLHHIEHAFLLFAGGAFGISFVRHRPKAYGDPLWLFGVVALSTLSLVLMLPDVYGTVDAYPVLHTLLHIAFVVVGWFGGYCAERYSPRAGSAWLMAVAMTVVFTATGFGFPAPHA